MKVYKPPGQTHWGVWAAKVRALASEAVRKALEGKQPKQVIVVKGKLVNIVL